VLALDGGRLPNPEPTATAKPCRSCWSGPADEDFHGRAFAASQAARGTAVLVPPDKKQRAAQLAALGGGLCGQGI
jgi:hypothetical protein